MGDDILSMIFYRYAIFIFMIFKPVAGSAPSRFSATWLGLVISIDVVVFMSIRAMCLLLFKMTAFLNHISKIISAGSNEKMIWINASWIVACMAYEHVFRYWPNPQNVRRAVRRHNFFININPAIISSHFSLAPLNTARGCYV